MQNYRKWISQEKKKINVFDLKHTAITSNLLSGVSFPRGTGEEQMLVAEKRVFPYQLAVKYTFDEKTRWSKAKLPFEAAFKTRNLIFPRQEVVRWLYSPQAEPYLQRALSNWILNWLMGRGISESIEDSFDIDSDQEEKFSMYSKLLKEKNFKLHEFIRVILLSKEYRQKITMEKPEGIYSSRNLRFLSGRQMVNTIFHFQEKEIYKQQESSQNFTEIAEIEVKKNTMIQSYFAKTLTPELNEKGSTHQSLFTIANEDLINYINNFAVKGKESEDKKTWLESVYKELLTRNPTEAELALILNHLDGEDEDKYFQVVWALANSPEYKLY